MKETITPKAFASALALLCLRVTRGLTPRLKGVIQTTFMGFAERIKRRVLRVLIEEMVCMILILNLYWNDLTDAFSFCTKQIHAVVAIATTVTKAKAT